MVSIGLYDFTVKKGDTWSQTLTFRDSNYNLMNLTGYTARIDIRATQASSSAILALTSAGSVPAIALGGTAGTLTITVANTVTSAIAEDSAVYDLQMYDGVSNTTTYLEGKVTFVDDITR